MSQPILELRDAVLMKALPVVEQSGWTWNVVEQAMVSAKLQDDVKSTLFPNGLMDVVAHFSNYIDRQMLKKLAKIESSTLRSKDKVRVAVLARYQIMNNYKGVTKQSMAFWALPSRVMQGQRVAWRTADSIWNWAGDTATDYNRQTKRALLTSILVGTTMVWLTDESEDHIVTQAFLDRRLENVMEFGKTIGTIKKIVPNLFRQANKNQ